MNNLNCAQLSPRRTPVSALFWLSILAAVPAMAGDLGAGSEALGILGSVGAPSVEKGTPVPKAALAQVLGSRATVDAIGPLFGGFALATSADVYIIVRGNSLGTMGITQSYLDAPRVRIYNVNGTDLIFDNNGNPGFNACTSSGTFSAPVYNMYAVVRGQPPDARDACTAHNFAAGVYTFSVMPTTGVSVPSLGEVLFEVTLNP
jgi:hypothetical protein